MSNDMLESQTVGATCLDTSMQAASHFSLHVSAPVIGKLYAYAKITSSIYLGVLVVLYTSRSSYL